LGVVFFTGLFWHWWSGGIPESSWLAFWGIVMIVGLVLGFVFTVWFVIGGIMNVKEMFHLLSTRVRDAADDGVVRDDYGQEDAEAVPVPAPVDDDDS
jgi:solute:Na+ symporter, SSS family